MRYNFKYYCKDYENIENYEKAKADDFKNWEVHHRVETHTSDGERRLVYITRRELIALNMYYNRPADELIFLTIYEHKSLHQKGKHHSEESKKKMSEAKKEKYIGKDNPFYGKHHSEESKKKISDAKKGKPKSEETRNKMSDAHKGKYHSEETKKKIGEINKVKMKGMRFFNNGKINIRAKECPDGFVPGRIKKALSFLTQG